MKMSWEEYGKSLSLLRGTEGGMITIKQLEPFLACKGPVVGKIIKFATDGKSSTALSKLQLERLRLLLTHDEWQAQAEFLFSMLDLDDDGLLTQEDLMVLLNMASDNSGLKLSKEDMQQACSALMMTALGDSACAKGLTREDLLAVLEFRNMQSTLFPLCQLVFKSPNQTVAPDFTTKAMALAGKLWLELQTPHGWFCTFLAIGVIAMFAWGIHDNRYTFKAQVMGPAYPIARACAYIMRLTFMLLLITVCTPLLTWMRSTELRHVLPLDQSVSVHILLGTVLGVSAVIHAFCLIGGYRAYASLTNTWQFVEAGLTQPTIHQLYSQSVSITGLVLLIILFLCYPFAASRWLPLDHKLLKGTRVAAVLSSFSAFWHSHHLLWVTFVAVMIIHPYPSIVYSHGQLWMWICVPLLCFLLGRARQAFRRRHKTTKMILVSATALPSASQWDVPTRQLTPQDKPEGVTKLTMRREFGGTFHFIPGQYVYLNIKEMSTAEWHPFTISSAPEDDFLTLHVAAKGDWTRALYRAVHNARANQAVLMQGVVKGSFFPAAPHVRVQVNTPLPPTIFELDASGSMGEEASLPSESAAIQLTMTPEGATLDPDASHPFTDRFKLNSTEAAVPDPDDSDARHTDSGATWAVHVVDRPSTFAHFVGSGPSMLRSRFPTLPSSASLHPQMSTRPTSRVVPVGRLTSSRWSMSGHAGLAHVPAVGTHILPTVEQLGALIVPSLQSMPSNLWRGPVDAPLTVRIDGPLGAPAQNYEDYEVLVCLAAGIGVTPMASILRHLVHQLGARQCSTCMTVNLNADFWLKKLYFHWVVREQQAPHWFQETLSDIGVMDPCGMCELNIHLTSAGLNIGNVILKLAQQAMQEATGVCLLTGLPSSGQIKTTFGRPDLVAIMKKVAQAHPTAKIGVLFCGANVMGASLAHAVHECGHPNMTLHREVF